MKKERILYLEVLRVISSIAVVMIHVIAAVVDRFEVTSLSWDILVVCSSIIRWCIPVFFMISGSLFLSRNYDNCNIAAHIKKYVIKILVILIVFGTLYYFFDLWIWKQSIGIKNILVLPLAIVSGNTGYHLWYLYPLVIIYLLTPVLGLLVSKVRREYVEYLIILCIVLCFVAGYVNEIIAALNLFSYKIQFFFCEQMGYVGCYIIGFYLSKYDLSEPKKKLLHISSVACLIVLTVLNLSLSLSSGQFTVVFSSYTGLPTVLIACSLFVLFKQTDENRVALRAKRMLCYIGSHTFGIYLFHVFFVSIIFRKIFSGGLWGGAVIVLIVGTIVVFACSYVCSLICKKLFPKLF